MKVADVNRIDGMASWRDEPMTQRAELRQIHAIRVRRFDELTQRHGLAAVALHEHLSARNVMRSYPKGTTGARRSATVRFEAQVAQYLDAARRAQAARQDLAAAQRHVQDLLEDKRAAPEFMQRIDALPNTGVRTVLDMADGRQFRPQHVPDERSHVSLVDLALQRLLDAPPAKPYKLGSL